MSGKSDEAYLIILILVLVIILPLLFFSPMWMMHSMMMGGFSLFSIVFIIVIIALISLLAYFLYRLTSKEPSKDKLLSEEVSKKVYVYPLTEEEKKVVDFIKQNGGKIEQKIIQDNLGFSKVKLHRILARLESRGIIIKVKRGREMLVLLKKTETIE